MRIEFWGVRGSLPSSHPGTVKYGGNTSCVEVRTRANDLIVIDAGSGIRRLGVHMMSNHDEIEALEQMVDFMVDDSIQNLKADSPASLKVLQGFMEYGNEINLLLSHFHWDHIQGFPFFIPAYVPNRTVNIFGPMKADHRITEVLSGQMSRTYFPVSFDMLGSKKNFFELVEDTFRIGDSVITTRPLSHPQGGIGYRIVSGEMTVAYCSDTEHPENGLDENVLTLADNADIFIYDCQYTPEEYKTKKSWGHSTYEMAVQIAKEAGVKKIIMFHHDPEHDDKFIQNLEMKARDSFPNLLAAYEGLVVADFPDQPTDEPAPSGPSEAELAEAAQINVSSDTITIVSGPALRGVGDSAVKDELKVAARPEIKTAVFELSTAKYHSGYDLAALADSADIFRKREIKVRIVSSGPLLTKKLKDSRFHTFAEIVE